MTNVIQHQISWFLTATFLVLLAFECHSHLFFVNSLAKGHRTTDELSNLSQVKILSPLVYYANPYEENVAYTTRESFDD